MLKNYSMLNLILAVAAVAGTIVALGPALRVDDPAVLNDAVPEESAAPGPAVSTRDRQTAITAARLEQLYRKSLFHRDRTEIVEVEQGASGPDDPKDMELVGIGVLGNTAVAVIRSRSENRRGPGSQKPSSKSDGNLYREGDEVHDTGYRVQHILLNEVHLRKGGAERILHFDRNDPTSAARRGRPGASRSAITASGASSAATASTTRSGTSSSSSRTIKVTGRFSHDNSKPESTRQGGSTAAAGSPGRYAVSGETVHIADEESDSRGYAVASGNDPRKVNGESNRTTNILKASDVRKKLVKETSGDDE